MTIDEIRSKYATDSVQAISNNANKENSEAAKKLLVAKLNAGYALISAYRGYAAAVKAYADMTRTKNDAKEQAVKLIKSAS